MMKKFFAILLFLFLSYPPCVFSEEIEIRTEVLTVDSALGFFIISVGEAAGIEIGDGLIVHRAGEKIGEAYIIETRQDVSAAEIIKLEDDKMIAEGDSVLIVKKREYEPEETYETGPTDIPGPEIAQEGSVITLNIDTAPSRVFSYSRLVLKEKGFSITSSNRAAGVMLATKPITLSILKELLADALAAIDHTLAVSFEIRGEGNHSTLVASSSIEHSQKGKHIKRPVTNWTAYYNELVDLVSEIKQRSEY